MYQQNVAQFVAGGPADLHVDPFACLPRSATRRASMSFSPIVAGNADLGIIGRTPIDSQLHAYRQAGWPSVEPFFTGSNSITSAEF